MRGRYDHSHDHLPWGWWLRARSDRVEDERGDSWPNVRAAFWEGRLRMGPVHGASDQLELLLRVLNHLDAKWVGPTESRQDLFGGDLNFSRFYMNWLASVGLAEEAGSMPTLPGPLTDEGRSAALMLRATREPAWIELPMTDVIDAVGRADRDGADEAREEALRLFERELTGQRHVFARELIGRSHMVTLTGIDARERMPMRRVSWSAPFADERVRDDLFAWLAVRVHRWDDWGVMARDRGAGTLMGHLLRLLVESPARGAAPAGPALFGGGS